VLCKILIPVILIGIYIILNLFLTSSQYQHKIYATPHISIIMMNDTGDVSLNNFRKIACNQTKILSIIHVNECFRICVDLKNDSNDTVTMSSSGSLSVRFDKPETIEAVPLNSHMPFDIKIYSGASKSAITSNGYKILSSSSKSVNALITATIVHTGDIKKFSKLFVIDVV